MQETGHAAQFWHVPQLLQRLALWPTRPSLVGASPAGVASRTFDSEMCRVRQPDHDDLPWHGHGVLPRMGHGRSARFRRMGLAPALRAKPRRECLVCHRPAAQVYFGMDCSCYKAWCVAGRPDRDTWAPTRRAWLDGRGRLRSKKESAEEPTAR